MNLKLQRLVSTCQQQALHRCLRFAIQAFATFLILVLDFNGVLAQNITPTNTKNFGFTSAPLLYGSQVPVRSGSNLIPTDVHVYYIGANNKVCEYLWNGVTWVGGSQLEWSPNYVQANTQICNNGNELFFVRSSDNRICRLAWNGTWQVSVIMPNMIPVRPGTDIIYNNNVIYYVGKSSAKGVNNKVCYISRPSTGSGFNSNGKLASGISMSVLANTNIIYVGPYQDSPSSHVYYIGSNNKICDIVNDTGIWVGSPANLGGPQIPNVRTGSNITNNKNQLFFVSDDNKIHEIHRTTAMGWVNGPNHPAGTELVREPSPITFFENHVYYVGASHRLCDIYNTSEPVWGGGVIGDHPIRDDSPITAIAGTTGHHVFYFGQDNRVRCSVWDDKICMFTGDPYYCESSECQGQQWHNGVLNGTAMNGYGKSVITGGANNTLGNVYYIGQAGPNGYGNVFLRSVLNGINKPGWILTMNDEFESLRTTKSLWDAQGPWAHGWCNMMGPYQTADGGWVDDWLWGDLQYGNGWNNFQILGNGVGRITTKQESVSGSTWGWATGPGHDDNFYDYWEYDYTNSILATGGINVGFECEPNGQHCYCGGNSLPPNCENLLDVVNDCGNYVPKYVPTGIPGGEALGPDMVPPKFYQKYGWFEIRCRVPKGKGMWNAFWAVGKGFYPEEIDFFEIDGNGRSMLSNVHYKDCATQTHQSKSYFTAAVGYRFSDDFYTYACEWGPNYIKWYLNNQLVATETQETAMLHDSMWIEVNNYVQNAKAACENENFPNYYDIDYVRIYQKPEWAEMIEPEKQIEMDSQEDSVELEGSLVEVYPNPVDERCVVGGDEVEGGKRELGLLIVYNTLGHVMYEREGWDGGRLEINTKQWSEGSYILRLITNEVTISKPLIVRH